MTPGRSVEDVVVGIAFLALAFFDFREWTLPDSLATATDY